MDRPASAEVRCPTCGKPAPWTPANPYRPFCSGRCKGIDLGAWANEEYRIPAAAQDDEMPVQDEE